MSKWEKAKSVYVSISLACMIAYLAIGIVAGVVYGVRHIAEKLRSRKSLDKQFSESINGIDEDEVFANLKKVDWDCA